ncbi:MULTISPECIES: uracil-DNA glycosylase family protein [Cupriavidus]|uniref:uracil-DNA glycosylase family protein n=1 Tax=Cupriavidus sp. DF5525 TaxID=3160989 RepID=UPI0032DFF020
MPGEGAAHARIMLVGEQPGAQEDLQGSPFVGPAGHLLDEALGKAGLDRDKLFMTNAVKCLRERGQGGPRRPARPTAQGHRRRVHRPDPRA